MYYTIGVNLDIYFIISIKNYYLFLKNTLYVFLYLFDKENYALRLDESLI